MVGGITKVHVLGATTGPVFLADHGTDDNGSSGGGSDAGGSGGSSGTSGSGSSGIGASGSGLSGSGSDGQAGTAINSLVSGSTTVDCVGPDGRHFTTGYHDCQELNQKWGKSNFSFTTLTTDHEAGTSAQVTPTEVPDPTRDSHKTIDIELQNNRGKFTVTQAATLHLETQDGHVVVKAKEDSGNEVELNGEDAIDQINKSLESDGIEVSQSGHNTLAIKRASVSAETVFPLSIDPITHELTITTPSGVKQVTVLPDQAVHALIESKLMTNVASQSSTDSAETTQVATLTELNNQAVFEIQGVSQKHFFGLFPVGFAKTAFVSATTGQVVQLNESALNKLLEAFSF